jgi:hypothetical protein
MLNIFVGEAFASRALGQTDTFAQRTIVSLAISSIQILDRRTAADAYWHAALLGAERPALLNYYSRVRSAAAKTPSDAKKLYPPAAPIRKELS